MVSDQFYPSGNIHPLLLPDIPIVSPQRAKDFLLTVPNLFDHQGYKDNFDYIPEVRDGIYKVTKTNDPCSPHWKRKIIYDGYIWTSREHIQNYVKLQYTSELTPQAIRNILSDDLGLRQAWHLGLINLDHQKLHFWQRHGNRQAHNILVVSALQDKKLMKSLLTSGITPFDCTQHNQEYDQRGFTGQENIMGDILWRARCSLISIVSYAVFYIFHGVLVKY